MTTEIDCPQAEYEKLLNACATMENWEAKLHILQLLPHFRLTDKTISLVDDFLQLSYFLIQ